MLVAGEALHKGMTLSKRWPAVVAFLFGLVHGLGFAGALKEIGLPQKHLAVALLTFNVGVELGQLLVVAISFAIYRALSRHAAVRRGSHARPLCNRQCRGLLVDYAYRWDVDVMSSTPAHVFQ